MLRSCAAAIRSAVLAELDRQLAASTEHLETMSSDALASLANLLASRVTLCEAALARRRNGAVGSSSASAPPASYVMTGRGDDAGTGDAAGFAACTADDDGINEEMLLDSIAIDCEMIQTETQNSALARVCAVSWDEEVIMDQYVAPGAPVTDYLTVRHKDSNTCAPSLFCCAPALSPRLPASRA